MSDEIPMPSAPTEEAVREWLLSRPDVSFVGTGADELARAFLKWAEAKVREALDAPLAAPSGGDATPSAREIREACVKHVADAIAACYRRAWTSPDEMRGATGALKRLAVSMANLPLAPAPAASAPADDAVARLLAAERAQGEKGGDRG